MVLTSVWRTHEKTSISRRARRIRHDKRTPIAPLIRHLNETEIGYRREPEHKGPHFACIEKGPSYLKTSSEHTSLESAKPKREARWVQRANQRQSSKTTTFEANNKIITRMEHDKSASNIKLGRYSLSIHLGEITFCTFYSYSSIGAPRVWENQQSFLNKWRKMRATKMHFGADHKSAQWQRINTIHWALTLYTSK